MQLGIPLVSTYHTTYEDYTHYVNFIHSRTVDSYAKKGVAKVSRLYGDASISVIAPSQKTKDMLIGYHIRRDIDVIPTGLIWMNFIHLSMMLAKQLKSGLNLAFQLMIP